MQRQPGVSLVSFLLDKGAESLKSLILLIKFFMISMTSECSNSGKMTVFQFGNFFLQVDLQTNSDIIRL